MWKWITLLFLVAYAWSKKVVESGPDATGTDLTAPGQDSFPFSQPDPGYNPANPNSIFLNAEQFPQYANLESQTILQGGQRPDPVSGEPLLTGIINPNPAPIGFQNPPGMIWTLQADGTWTTVKANPYMTEEQLRLAVLRTACAVGYGPPGWSIEQCGL